MMQVNPLSRSNQPHSALDGRRYRHHTARVGGYFGSGTRLGCAAVVRRDGMFSDMVGALFDLSGGTGTGARTGETQ